MTTKRAWDSLLEPLPFPTKDMEIGGDVIQEYVIPESKKADVLRLLYPFHPVPSLDDRMLDLHEDREFFVREFRVARDGMMNLLVSPYYPNSGGTVIDWWPV